MLKFTSGGQTDNRQTSAFIARAPMELKTLSKITHFLARYEPHTNYILVYCQRFVYLTFTLLLSFFLRCANPQLFFAAYHRSSLTLFINNNLNYQVISSFELYLIKCAPPPVKKFLYQVLFQRIKSHDSWDSCSEGFVEWPLFGSLAQNLTCTFLYYYCTE